MEAPRNTLDITGHYNDSKLGSCGGTTANPGSGDAARRRGCCGRERRAGRAQALPGRRGGPGAWVATTRRVPRLPGGVTKGWLGCHHNFIRAVYSAAPRTKYEASVWRKQPRPRHNAPLNPEGIAGINPALRKSYSAKKSTLAVSSGVRKASGCWTWILICRVPLARLASGAISATIPV